MGSPLPVVPAQRTKIAVVGFASNTRDEAPYKDTTWEIWGLNNLWNFLPRYDRWFEIHDPKQIEQLYGAEYVGFLKATTSPLYMQAHFDEYPASISYPKAEMEARVVGRKFWPSSISYMLALAIDTLTDYTVSPPRAVPGAEIGVWGIDLLGDDEYSFQREGCGHLIGVAEGRGIKVTVPEKASLLKTNYDYGYDSGEFSPDAFDTFLMHQAGTYERKQQEAMATVHTYDGAKQAFLTARTMFKHYARGGAVAKPEEAKKP